MKKIQDERITQEARKQNSIGFTILYYGILIDILYRQFILKQPVASYWDLALLFFGVTLFIAAKRIGSGLLTSQSKNNPIRVVLPSSIAAALAFTGVNYWWLGNKSTLELITGGLVFFAGFFLVNILMRKISNKKNEDLLDDD